MVESLGQYLKRIRTEREYSTRQVEIKTRQLPKSQRISRSYLSQVERETSASPSPDKLLGLARAYGLSYEDLMRRAGYLPERPEYELANLRILTEEELADEVLSMHLDHRKDLDAHDRAILTTLISEAHKRKGGG